MSISSVHEPAANHPLLYIGIDVGSTTVKATVVEPTTRAILWHDYQRHHTKQPEYVLDYLKRIEAQFGGSGTRFRVFMTGSGAGPIAPHIGARFVQEVNAVTMAVEHLYPDVGSVIELGGQDAKIIIFKTNPDTGERQAITSMNDKCASGTGATIDKCVIKVGMPPEDVCKLQFAGDHLHHVAAKCGVFAETDIVNLVKSGVPADEVLCSLAEAIVMQNLSVLTRGNTLRHRVILLGGPNTYLPFLRDCWRARIPETWRDRGYEYPQDVPVDELIFVPQNAELFAAYGAVLYGMFEPAELGNYSGMDQLADYITHGRKSRLGESAGPALIQGDDELASFRSRYTVPRFIEPEFTPGQRVEGYLGVDGGSTSSKCVVVDGNGEILLKAYQLSKGNPIQDIKEMLSALKQRVTKQGATLHIKGFGVTGYAADVLEAALYADVNVVETVAHMKSATHFIPAVDVICDIGGQDIKVLMIAHGELKNFRLSNQCSAGNGMLLQAMADQFGVPVTQYADVAFSASLSPKFSYGCAVFLDSDRVNFQKEGYSKDELMAGLAMVLPKNVWQYVVQIPRIAELGRTFVLQGGTQYNLAAVKAQVDYLKERVPDADVFVHPHPGEAGAIGAALEALRVVSRRGVSTFVGLDAAIDLHYTTKNDAETTCHFCPNHCSRTFIDTRTPDGLTARYISGFSCEKGTVEDKDALKTLEAQRRDLIRKFPNLVNYEARQAFRHIRDSEPMPAHGAPVDDIEQRRRWFGLKQGMRRVTRPFQRSGDEAAARRRTLRVAMPKALNIWSTAPFFRGYFEALGLSRSNIVFSDDTSEALFAEGGKYGSIDPCFPSKVVQAHIHNLLFYKHTEKRPIHFLYFPSITHIPTFVEKTMDNTSCPIVAGTPNVIKAAFTKEVDFFAQRNIDYVDDAVTMNEPELLKQQLFNCWHERLGITRDESDFAVDQAWKALDAFTRDLEEKGRLIIEQIEREGRMGILMLGRPYHSDPGINHEITEEFQALGYPILSIRSIPKDRDWLARYFRADLEQGTITTPLEVNDVWPENYSANSVQKVWAAKFAARHPNIAVLDLSSFKCGHDAPTYGLIDSIIGTAGVAYSAMHDIDANKPTGSIKIRVKTYAHSLNLREENLQDTLRAQREQITQKLEKLKNFQLQLGASDTRIDTAIAQLEQQLAAITPVASPVQYVDVAEDPMLIARG